MYWKARIRHSIPPYIMNNILLQFPFLYRTKLIYYETGLAPYNGIDDLLNQLEMVIDIQGNIIECGSSLCGASIIMANYLSSKGIRKSICACDS